MFEHGLAKQEPGTDGAAISEPLAVAVALSWSDGAAFYVSLLLALSITPAASCHQAALSFAHSAQLTEVGWTNVAHLA